MKFLALFIILFLPVLAYAADTQTQPATPAQKQNVIIVNGKKFFPLQNARRFNGSTNNPSALQVLHHPRPPAPIAVHHDTPLPLTPPSNNAAGTTPPIPGDSTATPSDVLSIFTPEDKSVPVTNPTK